MRVHRYDVALAPVGRASLAAIADEWSSLCDEGPCAAVTLRPDWFAAYLQHMQPDTQLWLLTARRGGQLRAVAPFVMYRLGIGAAAVRWLVGPSTTGLSHLDIIHGVDDRREVIDAIARHLEGDRSWDVLHYRMTPDQGAFAAVSRRLAGQGHRLGAISPRTAWVVHAPQPGIDVDGYLQTLPKSLRKNLRRALRKLHEAGDLRLRVVDGTDDPVTVHRVLDDYFALEAAGWKGRRGDPALHKPQEVAFYHQFATAGQLRIHRLELDGTLIASCFGSGRGDTYWAMRSSYDETWSNYSPGHLINVFEIVEAVNAGASYLDWGPSPAGEPTYKVDWADHSYDLSTRLVFRNSVKGRLLKAAMFTAAPRLQQHLPRWRSLTSAALPG